jgi:hypothetical protein
MTSLFDQLENQLRAAAHERAAARGPIRRGGRARAWLSAGARSVPVAVALVTTIAVVAVALVLAHHSSVPTPPAPGGSGPAGLPAFGSARARREIGYVQRATAATLKSPACTTRAPAQPAVIHGTPSRALLATLAVLRRPAVRGDHLGAAALEGITGLYPGAERLARVAGSIAYYLVPVRIDPAAGQPTSRCLAAQQAALRQALPSVPRALRAQTQALQNELIAYEHRLISSPPQDGVCLLTHGRGGSASSCSETLAAIRHGIGGLQENEYTYSDIVPDGVATVALRFAALDGRPAHTVSSSVVGNLFVASAPGPHTLPGAAQPSAVVWRAADGRVLHRYVAPTSAAAICRRDVAACLVLEGLTESAGSGSATSAAPSH